jgi:DNA-binding MarR family transcriptional regulator
MSAVRLRLVLVRLARALRQNGNFGLTQSQISVLATLEEFGSMRMSTLAAFESVGASVATRVAASLEDLRFVKKTADPEDRRACIVELTAEGRTVLANLWMERTIGLSSRLEGLTNSERHKLDAALTVLEKMVRDS